MPGLKAAVVPVTPFQQNCVILWDEATMRGAVVDPGGDVPRIRDALGKLGVTVETILLTHGHIDHAGGADALREALSTQAVPVPVVGPDERDAFLLATLAEDGRGFGQFDARAVRPDRWLNEGDTVTVGGYGFRVLHCPGHTPGHVVFVANAIPFAVLGDVLFQGSIGRTDFPYGDHDALLAAIRDKILSLGDEVAFLCGHGPGSTIGVERRSNPFLRD